MPIQRRTLPKFSREELFAIRAALFTHLRVLWHTDPGRRDRHASVARMALAKATLAAGQEPGDLCFLCGKRLGLGPKAQRLKCPDGCASPAANVMGLGHVQ